MKTRNSITASAFQSLLFVFLCSSCSLFGSENSEEISDGEFGAGEDITSEDLDVKNAGHWGSDGGAIPVPSAGGYGQNGSVFNDVRFGYNSAEVDPADVSSLSEDASRIKNDSSLQVTLEGHCDERGTSEYNLALGQRRADAVAEVLRSYGVSESQLHTLSYGEETPLNTEHDENAYAENRRVHFFVSNGPRLTGHARGRLGNAAVVGTETTTEVPAWEDTTTSTSSDFIAPRKQTWD
mgnify:CR=1 FL=1